MNTGTCIRSFAWAQTTMQPQKDDSGSLDCRAVYIQYCLYRYRRYYYRQVQDQVSFFQRTFKPGLNFKRSARCSTEQPLWWTPRTASHLPGPYVPATQSSCFRDLTTATATVLQPNTPLFKPHAGQKASTHRVLPSSSPKQVFPRARPLRHRSGC